LIYLSLSLFLFICNALFYFIFALIIHIYVSRKCRLFSFDSSESDEHTHGIVYREMLRGTFGGVSLRMQEMVPEPRVLANQDGVFYIPEERESHIRYIHRYSMNIEHLQLDNVLPNCDLPTLVSFAPFPHSMDSKHDIKEFPCMSLVLEMVAVHKRGPTTSSIYVRPVREPDIVLPYVKLFRLSLPRKAYIAAEETLLSCCTKMAQRCNEFEPILSSEHSTISCFPMSITKWSEDVSRPLLFMESVEVSAMKLSVTLRVFVPGSTIYLGMDRSPFFFRNLDMKRVFASSSH
jgi:hypothetical protein